jgi:hypothetical protein
MEDDVSPRRHPARVRVCVLCAQGRCDEHYIEWLREELRTLRRAAEAHVAQKQALRRELTELRHERDEWKRAAELSGAERRIAAEVALGNALRDIRYTLAWLDRQTLTEFMASTEGGRIFALSHHDEVTR